MDITKAPITSKLMILRAGCTNFRTVGDAQEVDFSTPSNNLIIGQDNGAGKSTLYLFLPYYMLTGKSYKQGDTVDSLINSDRFKNMTGFLEFHFAGTYYRVERGRKPNRFDIMSLVDGEWVEVPNLPVSAKDRQGFLYSIMGLERSSAERLIENTFLLGVRRFSGFLNMSTDDRRKLVEPIFDLIIFSQMNQEVKSLRSGKTIEQKQTGLEITNLNTKVALSEQSLTHIKTKKCDTEVRYLTSKTTLEASLTDCQVNLEKALQLDIDGNNLKETCTEKVKVFMEDNSNLEVKLTKDIDNLGEFKIDENDKVLVKLCKDLIEVDDEIVQAKGVVAKKKESLGNEVETVITETVDKLNQEHERFNITKAQLEEVNKKEIIAGETAVKILEGGLVGLIETHTGLELEYANALSNAELCNNLAVEAHALGKKYQTNIDKLIAVVNSFTTKIEIEQENVNNLTSEGDCPTCRQHVSVDWVEACKVSIQEKIVGLEDERKVYEQRAIAGEAKLKDLDLDGKTQSVLETGKLRDKLQREVSLSTSAIQNQERDIKDCKLHLDQVISGGISGVASTTARYEQEVQTLQGIIDRAEDKAKQALGEELANLKALEASAPQRIANLHQQIEDRKGILELDWGASKRSLQSNYKLAVDNISEKIAMLQNKLEEDLTELIRYKESEVSRNQGYVDSKQKEITLLAKNFNDDMNTVEAELAKAYKDHKVKVNKLEELNVLHDLQQKDIEDYDNLLVLLSDNVGKAEVIENYIPELNRDINLFLQDMGFYSEVNIDASFNMKLVDETRRGQSLYSLSEGETAKVNIAVMLSLRNIAEAKSSVSVNVIVLDEVLENLHGTGVELTIDMLKKRFQGTNLNVISQRNDEMSELFDEVRLYGKVGSFTKLIRD